MKFLPLILTLLLLPVLVQANDSSGGCGPGSQLFPSKTLISTSSAGSVDGTSFWIGNALGTTLGTSGCAKHDLVKVEKMQIHFIANNLEQLRMDTASGSGEHVVAFARTLGCKDEAVAPLINKVQKNWSTIFLEKAPAKRTLHKVKTIINRDQTLSAACLFAARA